MEITSWNLYWLFQLDSLVGLAKFFVGASLVSGLGMVVMGSGIRESHCEDTEKWKVGVKLQNRAPLLLIPFFLFICVAVFIPSTKTALMIWTIPPIANNEQVQQLPTKLVDALNGYLDTITAGE